MSRRKVKEKCVWKRRKKGEKGKRKKKKKKKERGMARKI
jgi:hypothetical protein